MNFKNIVWFIKAISYFVLLRSVNIIYNYKFIIVIIIIIIISIKNITTRTLLKSPQKTYLQIFTHSTIVD